MNGPDFQYDGLTAFAPITSAATAKKKGLLSAADKAKLDALAGSGYSNLAVDANGWYADRLLSGKRQWRKNFLGITLNAANAQSLLTGAALPVGVATQAIVDIHLTWRAASFAYKICCAVEGGESSTTLTVTGGTIDGTLLNASAATLDLFVTCLER